MCQSQGLEIFSVIAAIVALVPVSPTTVATVAVLVVPVVLAIAILAVAVALAVAIVLAVPVAARTNGTRSPRAHLLSIKLTTLAWLGIWVDTLRSLLRVGNELRGSTRPGTRRVDNTGHSGLTMAWSGAIKVHGLTVWNLNSEALLALVALI